MIILAWIAVIGIGGGALIVCTAAGIREAMKGDWWKLKFELKFFLAIVLGSAIGYLSRHPTNSPAKQPVEQMEK